MKNYDIIIIGAGPAGLFCAINAAENSNRKILILEKNSSAGKKFLLSGSGQCNITHTGTVNEFTRHYGTGGSFVKPALKGFPPASLISFLEKNNIPVIEREDGKIFPQSMSASQVLTMMLNLCRERNVEIKYQTPVMKGVYDNGEFRVSSDKVEETFTAPLLVITAGGKSCPATGSDGDGYRLARSLGHSIADPAPALAPLFIKNFPFAELSGISFKGRSISLFREGKKISASSGDILFTHKGLSGPGILDMSRYIRKNDSVKISLTGERIEDLSEDFISRSRTEGKKSIKHFLKSYDIPERLITIILELLDINPQKNVSEISKAERNSLLKSLCRYPFTVERVGDFNIAMATAGGVYRDGISSRTMESTLIPGLFFAGEVIDIDGDTGGYNLQWAFSSAKAAADHLLKEG